MPWSLEARSSWLPWLNCREQACFQLPVCQHTANSCRNLFSANLHSMTGRLKIQRTISTCLHMSWTPTHTMLLCLVSPFFMHVLHICSMNAQEIPHTDPYGHPSSVFSRRNWSWSTHTRRGRWMIGGPPNGMSLDVLLMGYFGGLLLHIITSV